MFALRQCVAAIGLATACLAASATGSVDLSPASSTVNPGDAFALTVSGSAFTDSVIGGGFDIAFDATRLTLDSLVIDTTVWNDLRSAGLTDNSSGTVSDVFFNSQTFKVPGGFAIATLNFTAKSLPGAASVSLLANGGLPFANDLGEAVAVSFGGATVNISAVPEPSTWALLAGGLMLLPMVRRRRA